MFSYPHTIENKFGEKLSFISVSNTPSGKILEVENWVQPGSGPIMHVHWRQDESLTVLEGKIATQIKGQPSIELGVGATVTFTKGVWHRFWNPGKEILHCKGYIMPADNIEWFLTEVYRAIDAGSHHRPDLKAMAFLLNRYKSEFDVDGIPTLVRKLLMPLQYQIGKLTGAYAKYKDAPSPVL